MSVQLPGSTSIYRRISRQRALAYKRIAERENAERLISNQLQHVIRGADLGYWDWNCKTGKQEVNDRWLSMLGLERTDIVNHVDDWDGRIHPADKERMLDLVNSRIETGKAYHAEYRMRHKRGHWVWIEGSGRVVEWDQTTGQAIRLCGTHQDISRRKLDEAYIRDSERRFRELIEALPNIAVQGYSQSRRVVFWNTASESLYGYDKAEAI